MAKFPHRVLVLMVSIYTIYTAAEYQFVTGVDSDVDSDVDRILSTPKYLP
ncbi:MAG: hypothetical protein ACRCZM_02360 [Bacteroidales bacterium]